MSKPNFEACRLLCLALMLECIFMPVQASQDERPKVLQLVAMVSESSSGTRPTQDWERGLEILPGARVAVQEVNRNTDILPGYQLELVELITEGCSGNLALVQLVEHLVSQAESEGERESQTVGIIGPLCNEAAELIATVTGHPAISLPQIAAAPSFLSDDRSEHPYLFKMLPLSQAYISTVLGLMTKFGWSKLAVLCSVEVDPHDCRTANAFEHETVKRGMKVLYSNIVGMSLQANLALLRDLRKSGSKITLAFLPPQLASHLLCTAYQEGLTYPKYAWILPGLQTQHFEGSMCDRKVIIEGLFLMEHQYVTQPLTTSPKCGIDCLDSNYTDHENVTISCQNNEWIIQGNPYAFVFYDAVWAFALALNQSSFQCLNHSRLYQWYDMATASSITSALLNLSFCGASGYIEFDDGHDRKYVAVQVSKVRGGASFNVAQYDPLSGIITFNDSSLGTIPSDELDTVYAREPLVLTVTLTTAIGICFVFTTLMLLLFIRYRDEPEVKATSTVLSMFLFLSCYILLSGTSTWVIIGAFAIQGSVGRIGICQVQNYFLVAGFDLISATLLIRLLRVYRVFSYFGRTGRICSNEVLAIFIVCAVLPNILIVSVWAAIDHAHLVDDTTYHPEGTPPYYEALQYCDSQHYAVWGSVVSIYSTVLLAVVVIMGFLTRKVRRAHFKDTKKVNFFILLISIVTTFAVTLTVVYSESPSAGLGLIVGIDMTIVFFCQLFLFLPKTGPPLMRHIMRRSQNGGMVSANITL